MATASGTPGWFEGFEQARFGLGDGQIFARFGGARDKPALLLLHGFPQTHAMWHRVALALKDEFFLVMPDLRGYGDSSKAPGRDDHANYSKRAMAEDMCGLMTALGKPQFFLAGHDRGARVAHRLAVDHPQRVRKLVLIDIAPTLDMYDGNWNAGQSAISPEEDKRRHFTFARVYYHWFHLIQPSPLPEKMIGADARFYLRSKLGGWGASGMAHVEKAALAEYERCFCRAESIHAACEDYRASASIDLEHDRESRALGKRICCDTFVMWGERGLIGKLFDPLALWQAQCACQVSGRSMPAGHFIPEELPMETAQASRAFFG
ncbi:MAG TPA: alpha/beta hydrolase [Ramlibacter sp.]|uniref:alpha/beta hydrolase n=1 Tax=Ramlibacter sp. TaxID=1917967 RepID=UPI002B5EF059|nr:alpha/beta hydrolase [Ramlibacter sp.]HVZ46172.1 alpha/beta hydrolase [Ramlibacter sp.]